MNIIDKKTVQHVALLSRLRLSEEELAVYSSQLVQILSYIDKLNQLDIKDTPPTSHAVPALKNVFRKDIPRPSLKPEDTLKNAPDKKGEFFRIPKVIEGK